MQNGTLLVVFESVNCYTDALHLGKCHHLSLSRDLTHKYSYEKCPILHKPLHPFHKNGLPRKGALMSPAEGRVGRLGKSERSPYSTPKACLAAMRAKVAVRPALMPVKLLG